MKIKLNQRWAFIFLIVMAIMYLGIYFFEYNYPVQKIKKIYFADRMTTAHKILIAEYNKLNAGKVEVVPVDFPNDDFSTNERKEIVARSLRGLGDGIDIFAVDIIWVQRFAKWCEPLDKYFPEPEKNKILSEAMESCYFDGEMVAAPLYMVQSVMYYRKDLLEKMKNGDQIIKKVQDGLTWDEFISLDKKLNVKNPFYIFPGADYEGLICAFDEQLLSLKQNYFEQNGFNFETPEAEKTLQLFHDLINKYKMSPSQITQFTEVPSYEYFIKNNGLFLWGWNSYDKDFKDTPYDLSKQNDLRKAPVPHFEGGKSTSILGGWDLMVSKFSDNKKEAVDFVKFLLKKQSQEIFYKKSAYYPVLKEFYRDSTFESNNSNVYDYKKYLMSGLHRPANEEYTKYSKIMSYYFNRALSYKLSVKDALEKCTKAIQLDKIILK